MGCMDASRRILYPHRRGETQTGETLAARHGDRRRKHSAVVSTVGDICRGSAPARFSVYQAELTPIEPSAECSKRKQALRERAMTVTASILYDLVECPQRVALDAFGNAADRDDINPFIRLLWRRGTLFERETIQKLQLPFVDLASVDELDRERLTLQAMTHGDPLIHGGRIVAEDLIGMPDLLRKEIGGYVPGDIKSGRGEEGGNDDHDGKPKIHYAVQLALYVDILERLNLSAGRRAFVWDVNGKEVLYDFTENEALWDEYQTALAEARVDRNVVPLPAHTSICKYCHWRTHCLEQLIAGDDLTLIPRLGRADRDVMSDKIPTIAALAATNPDAFVRDNKSVFPGIGAERFRLLQARAAMLMGSPPKAYLREPLVLKLSPMELFFDIEVDPLRDFCYLHGFVERQNGDNATERFVWFFAEVVTPAAERDAFMAALDYLASRTTAAIYYYSKYERTIYRKLQQKYPDVCTPEDVEQLFDPHRATDLYGDVVLKATEWPTLDHSIKTLAKYLGFTWRDTHPSGAASIEWFDRWCRDRNPEIRQRILDYNEDDCRATRVLLDGVRDLTA
jgi:predicted RecB family nuclease